MYPVQRSGHTKALWMLPSRASGPSSLPRPPPFRACFFYGAYFDFCSVMQVRLYGVKMKTQGKPAGIKKARRGGGPFLLGERKEAFAKQWL